MTEAEIRRIEALTTLITKALDEPPAPSVQAVAARRLFNRLSRRGRRAALATWALEDTVKMLKAHQAQDDDASEWYAEVEAARRWAKQAGQTARSR